jgi:hypothetical protein
MDEQVKAMFEQAVADGRQEFGSFFLSRLFGMDLTYGTVCRSTTVSARCGLGLGQRTANGRASRMR